MISNNFNKKDCEKIDEFKKRLSFIQIDELKAFLFSLKAPCYESELLRIVFQNININNTEPLLLYQKHFILFHTLYKLQEEYNKDGKYLHIHFMRTYLLDYPAPGKCRYYNEHSANFCSALCFNNNYCDFHLGKIGNNNLDTLSIKYFYLDKKNFYKIDKDTAEAFISGSWEILSNYGKYKKSFKVLNLPESADIDTIKKQFKYLAKIYHPDINKDPDKKFNEINSAYDFLMGVMPGV
ncbi:MAG: DnaJ domain-containing protein [Spirochaetes bacterium]|nr:DnaJ domain-containing protein [Spirochaetota bacterium]